MRKKRKFCKGNSKKAITGELNFAYKNDAEDQIKNMLMDLLRSNS